MKIAFPEFRSRAPWWGPDLQTLRNVLRAEATPPTAAESRRLLLPVSDGSGDTLAAQLDAPAEPAKRALVVLIHGLSGCETSAYMLASARFWLQRGHAVLRLNLRGAGPSRPHCRLQYHAGRSEDLRAALAALDLERWPQGLVLVGYSLGGNMLLKFLAEYGALFPICAAASVSAPIDLAAASQRFLARRNVLYHRHLLRDMKLESLAGPAPVEEGERAAILGSRSIYEFDDRVVAPRNGFRDAEHYYHENNARRFMAEIAFPTLLIQSLDDPWIPADAYVDYPWQHNRRLVPLVTRGGGHVGFHQANDRCSYFDRCIGVFVDRLTGGSPSVPG